MCVPNLALSRVLLCGIRCITHRRIYRRVNIEKCYGATFACAYSYCVFCAFDETVPLLSPRTRLFVTHSRFRAFSPVVVLASSRVGRPLEGEVDIPARVAEPLSG